jgi:hypothetical protein
MYYKKQQVSIDSCAYNTVARKMYNVKSANALQTQVMCNFKKNKENLLKTNASTWFNKICKNHQLTPKYLKIEVYGNDKECCNINNVAIKYRLTKHLTNK